MFWWVYTKFWFPTFLLKKFVEIFCFHSDFYEKVVKFSRKKYKWTKVKFQRFSCSIPAHLNQAAAAPLNVIQQQIQMAAQYRGLQPAAGMQIYHPSLPYGTPVGLMPAPPPNTFMPGAMQPPPPRRSRMRTSYQEEDEDIMMHDASNYYLQQQAYLTHQQMVLQQQQQQQQQQAHTQLKEQFQVKLVFFGFGFFLKNCYLAQPEAG